jgi:PBSX family phage terminase large subunit
MILTFERPNAKQEIVLKDKHKHVGFGGARGGGKSWTVRTKAMTLCLGYPGIKAMIIRKTYPELTENHIEPLRAKLMCGTPDAIAVYNDSKKVMTFENGSRLLFGYCNSESDVDRYQGTEVDVLFLDEATLLSETQIKKLTACVRGVNQFPKKIFYTCNPGGKSHAYIKRLFIDRKFTELEDPEEYSFTQSLVYDNDALMQSNPDYIKQLEALPEQLRRAWLYGDWDAFIGQAFQLKDDPEHYDDRRWTHVINPFIIPQDWKIWCTMDWGFAKPFAVYWVAVQPGKSKRVYLIAEYYGCTGEPNVGVQMDPHEVAQAIKDMEATNPNLVGRKISRVADPAIWGKQIKASVGEMFEEDRIYFERGNNDRLSGKMQMHYRLRFNEDGIPGMYVFTTCRHFIRTLPTLIYDEKHVEDIDTEGEDHPYDAVRYMLMKDPVYPEKQPSPPPRPYNPLDTYEDYSDRRYDFYRI